MDNLSTHSREILRENLGEELGNKVWDRFEIHHTPVHASWLNQAEIAIGMYSRQCLGDGRVGDWQALVKRTTAWNKVANERKQKIHWRFTKGKARKSMGYQPPA
jgi:hypothetical protein